MNTLEQIFGKIAEFVLQENGMTPYRHQNVIKQHTEKLPTYGDFGFPTTFQAWSHFVQDANCLDGTKKVIDSDPNGKSIEKLIEISAECGFPIEKVKFQPFRCLLFLNRQQCFSRVLKTVIFDNPLYGQWQQSNDKLYQIDAQTPDENNLTKYRCTMVAKVLVNLLRTSGFSTVQSGGKNANVDNLVDILVTFARRENGGKSVESLEFNNNAETRKIICGAVRSRRSQTADDFIEFRANDMAKMAEMKFGTDRENLIQYDYHKLGAAVVTFDLLKTKLINVIDFDKLCEQKSIIKGAAFILYNVARLQKLLYTFDTQVSSGYYKPLPELDQIDFGLLREEEEWQMLYVYVIGFPSMLERCIGGIDNGQTSIHLLCTFLYNLAALFSVYYHRVKILTDNLPQLAPVMFARIYFLKGLRVIFLKSLNILEIEPLDEM